MDSEVHWIIRLRERLGHRTAEEWGDIAVVALVLAGWAYICVLAFTGNL
jgi:hypothetical protein